MNFSDLKITLAGDATLNYGNFITAVINFLIMAFIVFLLMRSINKLTEKLAPKKEEAAPTEKECPYCKSKIVIAATRCPHCTSNLD